MTSKEAIRVLGAYTAGRFDLWILSGNPKARARAHIMSVLMDHDMPQSKSGINAMRETFYAKLGITGECLAEREEQFIKVCKESGEIQR